MKPSVAIIGFGRFGKLAAKHLQKGFQIVVYDSSLKVSVPSSMKRVSLREAAAQNFIVLCVPVSRLKSVLRSIAKYVRPGTLVCDICAVKSEPVVWMKRLLPKTVGILGTHPLFGPSSAEGGLRGHHIVLCPVRIPFRQLQIVHTSLRKAGLKVHHMSPSDHDQLMAQTLFLTQFIGRSAGNLESPKTRFTTPNYELLDTIIQRTKSDSFELFRDIYRFNPYAERILRKVMHETLRLRDKIV